MLKLHLGIMKSQVEFDNNVLVKDKFREKMHYKLGIKVEGYVFAKAYKMGFWDGIEDYYDYENDEFFTQTLHQVLEGIREMRDSGLNFEYEIIDNRPDKIMDESEMDEEIILGEEGGNLITLRDYQIEGVSKTLKDQVAIMNLATNAGKSSLASGFIKEIKPKLHRNERIAFFCDSKEILHQTMQRASEDLGIPKTKIGQIGDGKFSVDNKQIVFAMTPTVASRLKDPKKGVKFTPKERIIKFIAEEVTPKFNRTTNTRQLIRNYIDNCKLTTKTWQSAEEHLQYIAYDNSFTDSSAILQLNKYVVELDKILEKKNKNKFQKYKQAKDFVESVKVLIYDEAHGINGDTVFNTLTKMENAQYRMALTGTIDKKNTKLWQRMQSVFGADEFQVSNKLLIDRGVSSKPIIRMVPIEEPKDIEHLGEYLDVYKKGIVENDLRNEYVSTIASWFVSNKEGGVLISVNHIDHGERLKELLDNKGVPSGFTHGGLESEERSRLLQEFKDGKVKVLIASSILDQGVDIKSIGMLIMSGGNKSLRQNLQRIGRGLRLNGIEGNTLQVFDFIDNTHKYLSKHSKERMKIYEEEDFEVKKLEK